MDRHFGEIIRILQSFLQGSGKFIATQPKFSKPLPPDDKKINGRLRGFAGLKNQYYGKKKRQQQRTTLKCLLIKTNKLEKEMTKCCNHRDYFRGGNVSALPHTVSDR